MAAEEYVVHEVRLQRRTYPTPEGRPDRVVDTWHVGLTRPDGARGVHIFPASIFAQYAAELDIDPADADTLLDVVLHEPYIPQESPGRPPAQTLLVATPDGVKEPAAALKATAEGSGERLTPFTAATLAHAREAHLERIARAKERVQIVPPAAKTSAGARGRARTPADPLQVIRQHIARIDPDELAERRRMVDQARREHAEKRARRSPAAATLPPSS